MNEMISNNQWDVILSNRNVDEQWHTFTHKVNLFADQLIPRRKLNSNPNHRLKKLWTNTNALTRSKRNISCGKYIYAITEKRLPKTLYCPEPGRMCNKRAYKKL